MKRILALLLALLLLTGCSTDATEENTVNTISPTDAVTNAATVPETKEPMEEPTEVSPEAETEAPTETSTEEPAEPPTTEPPATEHKHNYSSRVTAPTCTQKGYTTYTCACGHSYKDTETNATGHDYKKTVVSPTKTAQGYTLYECKNCDYSYKDNYTDKLPSDDETEPPHQHSYSSQVTAPTCTAKGYTTYTCACGHSYKGNEKPALGHDYKSTVVAPTCTEMGYTLHECKNCSHSYKDNETRTDGHAYTKKTTVVAATCTTAGEVKWTCEICGYSYNETVDAKGHKWGNWVVTKEPTTTVEGVETRTCTRSGCGATETRAIEKLVEEHKHSYTSNVTKPTCENKGYITYTCPCGDSYKDDEMPALGHDWSVWMEIEGEEHDQFRRCITCSAEEHRAVEKPSEDECTNHSWGNWTSDNNGSYGSCTNCGQSITIDGSTSVNAKEVIDIINEYRVAEGLERVEWFASNGMLVRAHELTVYFSHNRPDGSWGVGTCIAAGYGSAQTVVDGWMGSSSHRGSLMNPNATEASAAYNGSFWVLYIG